jgi:small-conductance mechanosensitive channel
MFNRYTSLTQQSVDTTRTLETPPLVNRLFTIATVDRIHLTIGFLVTAIVVFVVCFWCLQMYKNLRNGGARPKAKELLPPLLLIVFLVINIQDLTFTTKNTVNFNIPLNKVVKEDGFRLPISQATCNEPNQSNLSTIDTLRDSYIKEMTARYRTYFY